MVMLKSLWCASCDDQEFNTPQPLARVSARDVTRYFYELLPYRKSVGPLESPRFRLGTSLVPKGAKRVWMGILFHPALLEAVELMSWSRRAPTEKRTSSISSSWKPRSDKTWRRALVKVLSGWMAACRLPGCACAWAFKTMMATRKRQAREVIVLTCGVWRAIVWKETRKWVNFLFLFSFVL